LLSSSTSSTFATVGFSFIGYAFTTGSIARTV
jgi:hypothetical protein